MYDTKELRIGNLVGLTGVEEPLVRVSKLTYNRIGYHTQEGRELISCLRFRPLKLTPEVMQAAGFEKVGQYHGDPFSGWYAPPVEGYCLRVNFEYQYQFEGLRMLKIGSLHQLQNLHFIMTGNELLLDPGKLTLSLTSVQPEQ